MRPGIVIAAGLFALALPAAAARRTTPPKIPPPPVALPVVAQPVAATPTWSAPVAPIVDERQPHVVSVSSRRAYLNRGAGDGLLAGTALTLVRGGYAAGACRLEFVSAHHAACVGDGVKVGDGFAVGGPRADSKPTSARLPPPTPVDTRLTEGLRSAEQALIPFQSQGGGGARDHRLEAVISHLQWGGQSAGGSMQDRVDVLVAGLPLAAGFRLNARITAIGFPLRPDSARYLTGQSGSLWVRELSVSQREADSGWTLAAGRLSPMNLPGLVVMDGAQAGLKLGKRSEIGAFGGLLPDSVALAPSLGRWTAGVYYAARHENGDGDWLRAARHEGRVGLVTTQGGAQVIEAQEQAFVSVSRGLDVAADARVEVASGTVSLTALRLDFMSRPTDAVRFFGGVRQFGPSPVQTEAGLTTTGVLRHGDLFFDWDQSASLSLGVNGGFAQDASTAQSRGYAGPTVGLPGLFGDRGGLSIGYREEFGWLAGRGVWAQSNLLVSPSLAVFTRVSYGFSGVEALANDLGLLASADARVLDWLSLRATGQLRLGVGAAGASAPGYIVGLALVLKRG